MAPVVHDEADDVGADPPGGVGGELHALERVVLLHRLHEPDVPLLDEVEELEGGAAVLVGDLHHQAQVGGDQLVGGVARRRSRGSGRASSCSSSRESTRVARRPRPCRPAAGRSGPGPPGRRPRPAPAAERASSRGRDSVRPRRLGARRDGLGRSSIGDGAPPGARLGSSAVPVGCDIEVRLARKARSRRMAGFARRRGPRSTGAGPTQSGEPPCALHRTSGCTGDEQQLQAGGPSERRPTTSRKHPSTRWASPSPSVAPSPSAATTSPTPVQAATFRPVRDGQGRHRPLQDRHRQDRRLRHPHRSSASRTGARKPSALVMCPTRELAIQVAEEIAGARQAQGPARWSPSTAAPRWATSSTSSTPGAEIVVGTPGRIYDHIRRTTLDLSDVHGLAASTRPTRCSTWGFFEEVTRILDHLPDDCQQLLFSATVPADIEQIIQRVPHRPGDHPALRRRVPRRQHPQRALPHRSTPTRSRATSST